MPVFKGKEAAVPPEKKVLRNSLKVNNLLWWMWPEAQKLGNSQTHTGGVRERLSQAAIHSATMGADAEHVVVTVYHCIC